MQYRKYGKQNYETSLLGLGCMRLPRMFDQDGKASVDKEKAFELIRYAAENGINYFDTAFTYHNTTSESILGEALDGGLREKVKIATKQPINVMKTQADIRKNLESTLKKLRTDYIDVYLIHNIQDRTWDEIYQRKIFDEYVKFKEEGLIKAIGFSMHGTYKVFADVLKAYPWDMCQVQQNMLDIDYETTEQAIIDAGEKGCAMVIMEPLRGGGLANAPKAASKVYEASEINRKPVEWAFRHLIDYPQVSVILSGMTTLEQLKENIEIFSKPDAVPGCLSEREKQTIAKARDAYLSMVTIPCTACEYCLPCPNNVDIPGAFSKYNAGMMFESFNQSQRSYMFSTNAGRSADKCVECGVCESKCPQHIDIMSQLKTAHGALKGWVE